MCAKEYQLTGLVSWLLVSLLILVLIKVDEGFFGRAFLSDSRLVLRVQYSSDESLGFYKWIP